MITEKYNYTKYWNFDLGYDIIYPIYIKTKTSEEFNYLTVEENYEDVYILDNETQPILEYNNIGIKTKKLKIRNWKFKEDLNKWEKKDYYYYLMVYYKMDLNTEYKIEKKINVYNYTDVNNEIYEVTEIYHEINKKRKNKFGEIIENITYSINNENIDMYLDIGDAVLLEIIGDYEVQGNNGLIKNEKNIRVRGGSNNNMSIIRSYGIKYYYTMEYIKKEKKGLINKIGFTPPDFPINVNI